MADQTSMVVRPAGNVAGALRLPGDKSISHRYALLAAIAKGRSRFKNFSTGADCASSLRCIEALGCAVSREDDASVVVDGCGARLHAPSRPLDCGNSGSTMRMLAGILAAQEFYSEMTGDASLSRRPMARVIEPLVAMGATITAAANGRPPLRITGAKLHGIGFTPNVPSAQVKSAVLFAAALADGETTVEEALPTRDHTEIALRAFGAELARERNRVILRGPQELHAVDAVIPGDISSAAFFICAAALFRGSNLLFEDVLLNPTRAALLDVLGAMGARISMVDVVERDGELVGSIRVSGGTLQGASIRGAQSAALIDELPVLAAIAPYTGNGVEIHDARELRVKESDRIGAVARNLRTMGADVQEYGDGLAIPGKQELHGAEIDSAGDHRIAMAFAVAALRAQGETRIQGAEAVAISFPEFFSLLESVAER